VVQAASGLGEANDWSTLGQVAIKEGSAVSDLDAASLARAIDRSVGSAFVTAKVARRSTGSTTLRIENRLPFTRRQSDGQGGSLLGCPARDPLGTRRRPRP